MVDLRGKGGPDGRRVVDDAILCAVIQ